MAYRSSSSTTFTATSALTATAPTGVASADRLLALITQDTISPAITTATGWNGVISTADTSGPDAQTIELHEKKNASGSDSYNFTSTTTDGAIVQVVCMSGRDNTAAAILSATINTTANASPLTATLTGVTALAQDDLVWMLAYDHTNSDNEAWATSAVSGFTERHDVAGLNWCDASTWTQDNVSAGATGNIAGTGTRTAGAGGAGWGGFVVAVPAAAAPGQYSIAWITA